MSWVSNFLKGLVTFAVPTVDPATGTFYVNGVAVTGLAKYTWAQLNGGTINPANFGGVPILIIDAHSSPTLKGGSLWVGDASAPAGWALWSGPLCYATFDLAPNPVTYPGLRIRVLTGIGLTPVDMISNSTRYVPVNGRANLVHAVYGTLASPTLTIGAGPTTFTFNIGIPTFPANLFAINDQLMFKGRVRRHNTNAVIPLSVCLGTAGTTSDATLWTASLAATDILDVPFDVNAMIGSNTAFTTNGTALQGGTGGAGFVTDKNANFNVASAMKLTIGGTKNANDTIDLGGFSLDWIAY